MLLAIIQHQHWEGIVTISIIWTDSESVTQVFGVQGVYTKLFLFGVGITLNILDLH